MGLSREEKMLEPWEIGISWFGDEDDSFEEEDEIELVEVENPDDPLPGEEEEVEREPDPEYLRVKQENENLRTLAGNQEAIQNGFKEIAKQFGQPYSQPVNQPQQRNWDEEADKRLFKSGETGKFLREFVQAEVTPLVGNLQNQNAEMEKRILQLDEGTKDIFREYNSEIEEEVKKVSRGGPPPLGAYQWATQQVAARHVGDLRKKDIDSAVDQALRERLEKKGLTLDENGDVVPLDGNTKAKGLFSETGSSRGGGGGPRPKGKKKVRYTKADVEAAARENMSLQDYLEVKNG